MTMFATAISLATSSGLSPRSLPVVQTRSVAADVYSVPTSTYHDAWNKIIEDQLVPWAKGQIELDDDLSPPSATSASAAINLARKLQHSGAPAPTDVLPSGNGGVWLEHRRGSVSVQIEVLRDGSIEFCRFEGTKLIGSELLPASLTASV